MVPWYLVAMVIWYSTTLCTGLTFVKWTAAMSWWFPNTECPLAASNSRSAWDSRLRPPPIWIDQNTHQWLSGCNKKAGLTKKYILLLSPWKKRWAYFATHCLPPLDLLVHRQNVDQNYWDTHNIRHLFNIYPPRINSNILRIWSQIQMDSMLYYSMAPSGLQVSSCNKSHNFYE